MAMAPRALAISVLICRAVVVVGSIAAFACIVVAPDVGFTALVFLKAALSLQLPWNVLRLLYDAAQVFLHVPLPPEHQALTALVIAEWVMMYLLFAAGTCSAAVEVHLEKDVKACSWLPPGTCGWYKASAVLTLCTWLVSVPIAVIMIRLRAICTRDGDAAAAAAAEDEQH